MKYINTLDEANEVLQKDKSLGEKVLFEVSALLQSYGLKTLDDGKCTYGGCVLILCFDELTSAINQFQYLDLNTPEVNELFRCDDGSICIHLVFIESTDYAISIYIEKGKEKS